MCSWWGRKEKRRLELKLSKKLSSAELKEVRGWVFFRVEERLFQSTGAADLKHLLNL